MNSHEKERPDEQEPGFPLQFKILMAIIVGGVLLLMLQLIGIF